MYHGLARPGEWCGTQGRRFVQLSGTFVLWVYEEIGGPNEVIRESVGGKISDVEFVGQEDGFDYRITG